VNHNTDRQGVHSRHEYFFISLYDKKQAANEWIFICDLSVFHSSKDFSTNLVKIYSSYPQLQPDINRENTSEKMKKVFF
jgi:hypothetical protein